MNKPSLVPAGLRPGDVARLISPSAASAELFEHRLHAARRALEKLGLVVQHTKPGAREVRFHRMSRATRLEEMHDAFTDPEVKLVLCNIGGVAANDLIKHLDFDLIRNNPKVFCGYSDITILHYAIFVMTGLRTFYGPMALTQWGEFPEPLWATEQHFKRVLFDAKPPGTLEEPEFWTDEFLDWGDKLDLKRPRRMRTDARPRWIKEGRATGRLYGGCLPSVLQLLGTPYNVDYRHRIMFLETPEGDTLSVGLPLATVRAQLRDLENAGIFEQISGLVMGRPYGYSPVEVEDFEAIIAEQVRDYRFPVLINASIGHTDPMFTLPLDGLATLNSKSGEFSLDEPCVEERTNQ